MNKELNFENFAKCFMSLVQERYPSSDKVRQILMRLVPDGNVRAMIIAGTQLRDAVRQVSVQLIYRSTQHRDEVFDAIIGALETLEDELEEMLENEESEEIDVDNASNN